MRSHAEVTVVIQYFAAAALLCRMLVFYLDKQTSSTFFLLSLYFAVGAVYSQQITKNFKNDVDAVWTRLILNFVWTRFLLIHPTNADTDKDGRSVACFCEIPHSSKCYCMWLHTITACTCVSSSLRACAASSLSSFSPFLSTASITWSTSGSHSALVPPCCRSCRGQQTQVTQMDGQSSTKN